MRRYRVSLSIRAFSVFLRTVMSSPELNVPVMRPRSFKTVSFQRMPFPRRFP